MRRRRTIQPRTPIYLGCEGESEVGYGALLNRLVNEHPSIHLHIHVEKLQPGAGDPHALVKRAVQRITNLERRRETFAHKAVLLDRGVLQKNQEAQTLAAQHGIGLIWQYPDHEAFLLRHLEGLQQNRPPVGTSLAALRKAWPNYQKGRTQIQLAERIDMVSIHQARQVEPDLDIFLTAIGITN
jgi:hypothetical protein